MEYKQLESKLAKLSSKIKDQKKFLGYLRKEVMDQLEIKLRELENKTNFFPESFIKLLKVYERLIDERLDDFIYKEIKNQLNKTKRKINNLLKQTIRNFYQDQFKNNGNWLKISKSVKEKIHNLKLNPREITKKEIMKLGNNFIGDKYLFIKINFSLKTPYISRGDESFYIIENPVCKEKVFKVPYIRPNSWKGKLRWVSSYNYLKDLKRTNFQNWKEERWKLIDLFGNEKDSMFQWLNEEIKKRAGENLKKQFKNFLKDKLKQGIDANIRGRLTFYPTFLDKYGLDIIAPHNRETRKIAKTGPITFETAPKGSTGCLGLLYFPFDSLSREVSLSEFSGDIKILKKNIPDLLTKYGFGAKTTAGYGIVNKKIEFQLLPFSDEIYKDKHFGDLKESYFIKRIEDLMGDFN